MQPLQTLQLHHPAEGETTEGDRGAVGDRRGFSLPDIPPGGAQAPPPALQALGLCIHRLVSALTCLTMFAHHKSDPTTE